MTDDEHDAALAEAAATGPAAVLAEAEGASLEDPEPDETAPDRPDTDESTACGAQSGDAASLSHPDTDDPESDGGGSDSMDALLPARRPSLPRRGRAPTAERLYIVTYDIRDPKRWRRVFRAMKGYGRWLQLSVFQCRLSGRRRADMGAALEKLVHRQEDHVVILDLGLADEVDPRVESIGKTFTPIAREAIIV